MRWRSKRDQYLRTGQISVSGRWWSVLGYAEHEIEPNLVGWRQYTHLDDADRILATYRAHLAKGMSLVRDLGRSEAAAMARAIVGLCAAPGVEVVAEGVETRDN